MNSEGTNLSNDMTKELIFNKINTELEFFDKNYFKDRDEARVNIYLTGVGNPDGSI